ncbi:MAG TPA: translation initiation factor IF-2 N-terminal domain-containing protein, partial [Pyrinomonadaceae bacterium]|nr:translation initiation factor IF-2 N-terminal domain-containing protein [Pyrinomonadaceae bacterium]
MSIGKTVRIYDLAKELKQDTKRVMEELRREGADVSVPSNSVTKELAEKIRNKYFPKKETAPARAIKVIKKVATQVEAETLPEEEPTVVEPTPEIEEKKEEKVITPAIATVVAQEERPKTIVRQIKLRQPPPETPVETTPPVIEIHEEKIKVVEEIEPPVVEVVEEIKPPVVEVFEEIEPPIVEAPVVETPVVENTIVEAPVVETPKVEAPKAKIFNPTGTKVKVLTLTKEA